MCVWPRSSESFSPNTTETFAVNRTLLRNFVSVWVGSGRFLFGEYRGEGFERQVSEMPDASAMDVEREPFAPSARSPSADTWVNYRVLPGFFLRTLRPALRSVCRWRCLGFDWVFTEFSWVAIFTFTVWNFNGLGEDGFYWVAIWFLLGFTGLYLVWTLTRCETKMYSARIGFNGYNRVLLGFHT